MVDLVSFCRMLWYQFQNYAWKDTFFFSLLAKERLLKVLFEPKRAMAICLSRVKVGFARVTISPPLYYSLTWIHMCGGRTVGPWIFLGGWGRL